MVTVDNTVKRIQTSEGGHADLKSVFDSHEGIDFYVMEYDEYDEEIDTTQITKETIMSDQKYLLILPQAIKLFETEYCNCDLLEFIEMFNIMITETILNIETDNHITIRPEIQHFAKEMELTMQQHDGKKEKSYKKSSKEYMNNRLINEFIEWCISEKIPIIHLIHDLIEQWNTTKDHNPKQELVDLANVSMMIHHNYENGIYKTDPKSTETMTLYESFFVMKTYYEYMAKNSTNNHDQIKYDGKRECIDFMINNYYTYQELKEIVST